MPVISVVLLIVIVSGVLIFTLVKVFSSFTQSAIQRLEGVHQQLLEKQKDLTGKIEAAEKDYAAKKEEGDQIADKLKTDAVEEARKKADEIRAKAKAEGEEIIGKAHASAEKNAHDIEVEVRAKMTDRAAELVHSALSENTFKILHRTLTKEFIDSGKDMDLTSVGKHIEQLIVKTPMELTKEETLLIEAFVKGRLNRSIKIDIIEDKSILAGIIFQFGTLLIDGSLSNMIKETANKAKEELRSG
jgi:F0F1-type ATP synthase membrane subunit b/b'